MNGKKMKKTVNDLRNAELYTKSEVDKHIDDACCGFVSQMLGIVLLTLKIDYGHRIEWLQKFVNDVYSNTDFIDNGMGSGKKLYADDIVGFWKDQGIDLIQAYNDSGCLQINVNDKGKVDKK